MFLNKLEYIYLICAIFSPSFVISDDSNEHRYEGIFDHNVDHIKEEIKDHYHMEINGKLSEKELNFYNFQMHDFDKNLLLDGLEILTAMNHAIDENSLTTTTTTTTKSIGSSSKMHSSSDDDDDTPDPEEMIKIRSRFRIQTYWNDKFARDSEIIDGLLDSYDTDRDGFISFAEYSVGKAKHRN